jgi:hypothetical protein
MDITKLPKWAQEHIANLERQRNIAATALQDFFDKQTPSDFFVENWITTKGERHYIQTNKITVKMDDGKEIYISKEQDGSFYLASGWGGLQIEPSASNVGYTLIKTEKLDNLRGEIQYLAALLNEYGRVVTQLTNGVKDGEPTLIHPFDIFRRVYEGVTIEGTGPGPVFKINGKLYEESTCIPPSPEAVKLVG